MTKYAIVIVEYDDRNNDVFLDMAKMMQHGFDQLGIDVTLCRFRATNQAATFPRDRRCILFGADLMLFFNKQGGRAEGHDHRGDEVPSDAIIFNVEYIPEPDENGFTPAEWRLCQGGRQLYIELMRKHLVLDYSMGNVETLARRGVTALHLPTSYYPGLTHDIEPPTERHIDAMFVGSLNPRRFAVVSKLRDLGRAANALFGVYGRHRDLLYNQSKIALNIHYYETNLFEVVRCSYLFANRFLVVSETGSRPSDDAEFWSGAIFCPYEHLVDVCEHTLSLPQSARDTIADRGFEIMRSRRIETYLAAILPQMESMGAIRTTDPSSVAQDAP